MTKSKARIILDHDDLDTDFRPQDIKESRKNACRKLSDFISSLEEHGGWVQLKMMQFHQKSKPKKSQEPFRRGSRPSQVKSRANKRPTMVQGNTRPSLISQSSSYQVSNNKFQPKFTSNEYKSQAMQSFNRRMTYSPGKKPQNIKMDLSGISSIKGLDETGFLSPVHPQRPATVKRNRMSEIEDLIPMPQSSQESIKNPFGPEISINDSYQR